MKRTVLVFTGLLLFIDAAMGQTTRFLASPNPGSSQTNVGSQDSSKPVQVATGAATITQTRLENDSQSLVYYLVLNPKSSEATVLMTHPADALASLRAGQDKLRYLAPKSFDSTLGNSEQFILGFAVDSGNTNYPIWFLRIPASKSPAWYGVSQGKPVVGSDGQAGVVRALDFQIAAAPVRIRGRFLDWVKYPDLMSFPVRTYPISSSRQANGKSSQINISDALSFGRAGTDIEHVRILKGKTELDIMISSHSLMTKGMSYLLRVYPNESAATNPYTLEIPMDSPAGAVVVWTSNSKSFQLLGNFASSDYYVEARLPYAGLPKDLADMLKGNSAIISLSSSYSDSSLSEEFYYGKVGTSVLPSAE